MAEIDLDGLAVDDDNNLIVGSGDHTNSVLIDRVDIAPLVKTFEENEETEVEADSLSRLDGLDEDGLHSLLLAASQVLIQMQNNRVNEAVEEQKLFDRAVRLRMAMTGASEATVRTELKMSDTLRASIMRAVVEAMKFDTEEEDQTVPEKMVLDYDLRWVPNRSVRWVANNDRGEFYYTRGSWYHSYMNADRPYSYTHFGYLDSDFFPLTEK